MTFAPGHARYVGEGTFATGSGTSFRNFDRKYSTIRRQSPAIRFQFMIVSPVCSRRPTFTT